jgi:hypothetical protein
MFKISKILLTLALVSFLNNHLVNAANTTNPCLKNPCKNSGSCKIISSSEYECSCKKGFRGKTCGLKDYCVSSPCKNGASCDSSGSDYSCECKKGYRGRNCDLKDNCAINKCQNGAFCKSTATSFTCSCRKGKYLQIKNCKILIYFTFQDSQEQDVNLLIIV